MTRSEEEAARKKLDNYLLENGGKLLAVASLRDHYMNVLRNPEKRALAARIIGHAYLVALQVRRAEPRGDLAASRTCSSSAGS